MSDVYLAHCPIHPSAELIESMIRLPEGALKQCSQCGQFISQCTSENYFRSMEEFNVPEGTSPKEKSLNRSFTLHAKRLKKFQRILNKPYSDIHLLDVGCSSGTFLQSAKALGCQVEGVDPAPQAADTANQAGLKVHTGHLEDIELPPYSFDVITIFEVIEHLKDPCPLIEHCHALLKPSGLLVIGTGNAHSWTARIQGKRWEYFSINNHGGHISFYNPKSIQALAEKTNFHVLSNNTRCVKLFDKGQIPYPFYRLTKILSELLNFPAKLFGQGHDMLSILTPY